MPLVQKPRGRVSTNVFKQGKDVQRQINAIAAQLGRAGTLNLSPHQVGAHPGHMNNVQIGGPFRHQGGQQYRIFGGRSPSVSSVPSNTTVTGNDIAGQVTNPSNVFPGTNSTIYGPVKFSQAYGAFNGSQASPFPVVGSGMAVNTWDATGFTFINVTGQGWTFGNVLYWITTQ